MSSGLYPNAEIVERFQASVSAANLAQPFIAPCDLDIIGLLAVVGTAPGSTNVMTLNVNNSPTSQLANVSAYNLWTAANVPGITGTSTKSFATSTTQTLIENIPYPLNYPLPGPSGTRGYVTAQATSQTTETPVVAPPTMAVYQLLGLTPPDNTYTDFNGVASTPASLIHAGDVLTFVVGGAVGSAANLAISLYMQKR
jgi:hypothetical protein